MNFTSVFSLLFKLAIPAVLTIQQLHGDAVSGADKKTMATDALNDVATTALSIIPAGSQNAAYATIAANTTSQIIDAVVAFTKATGQYQSATASPKPIASVPVS